jgi:integrase/recombinase XerC
VTAGRPGPDRVEPPAGWYEPLQAFRRHCLAAGHSPATVRLRWSWLMRLARRHPDPWAVRTDDLEVFLSWARWRPETRRAARTTMRTFYSWASATGQVAVNPAAGLASIAVPPAMPRPVPDRVVARALPDVRDDRAHLAILLALLAGLRLAEIAGLNVRDVDVDRLVIRGKGGRLRIVPLHPELASALSPAVAEAKRSASGWLFPSTSGGWRHVPTDRHLTPAYLGKLVAGALGDGWTTHKLRHAAATNWYRLSGHDLFAVQGLLGHSRPETTARYALLASGAMQSAVLGVTLPTDRR